MFKFASSPDMVVRVESVDKEGDVTDIQTTAMDLSVLFNEDDDAPRVRMDIENYPKPGTSTTVEVPYESLVLALATAALHRLSDRKGM